MMDFIDKALPQAPGLAIMLAVVFMFLRSMEKRDSAIERLHEDHIDARRESREAIKENTVSNREIIAAIHEWRRR